MKEAVYLRGRMPFGRKSLTMALSGMLMILNIGESVAQTAAASNSGPVCTGSPVILSETGGDAVSWEWSSTGAAVFNDNTLQNPTATGVVDGEVFTVRITDAVGGTAEATTRVTVVSAVPERPGQITGEEEHCRYAVGVVYSISHVPNATSYRWEVPEGVMITSGQGSVSITVDIGAAAPATGTVRVFAANACGEGTFRPKNLTVSDPPAAAGAIAGSLTFTPGAVGVPYSVNPVDGATSHTWSYTGTGVTINGNGSNIVTLDFSAEATGGTLSVRGVNSCGEGSASTQVLAAAAKTLHLSYVLLEGLYSGAGTMRQAWNATGPQYATGVADHITIELHDATNYQTVVWSLPDVPLSTTGAAEINIPAAHSGSYYITVRHRNSIETTSALPVSLAGSAINYSFSTPSAAYGGNLKFVDEATDHYLIYGGDTNNDGVTDGLDLIGVENGATTFSTGYLPLDINGDGIVDALDLILAENNALNFVMIILP